MSGGLKLTQAAVGEIFGGKITKWNDPAIAKTNPGVNLPDQAIKLVVRADGSGTTFVFTNAVAAASPFFRGKIGVSKAPKWAGCHRTTRTLRQVIRQFLGCRIVGAICEYKLYIERRPGLHLTYDILVVYLYPNKKK